MTPLVCALTQYGADEPDQTVELIRQTHLEQHWSHVRRLHGVAELDTKEDAAVEEQLLEGPSGGKFTEVQLVQRTGCVGRWGRRGTYQLPPLRLSLEVVGPVTEVASGGCWEAGGFGERASPDPFLSCGQPPPWTGQEGVTGGAHAWG